jgi:hypothetical protein
MRGGRTGHCHFGRWKDEDRSNEGHSFGVQEGSAVAGGVIRKCYYRGVVGKTYIGLRVPLNSGYTCPLSIS